MQRIVLLAIGAVLAWTSLALADPMGTYHSVMDWRTAGGGYKVLQGDCTFGVGTYQCPALVSNDGTCKAYVSAVFPAPNVPPYQVQFSLTPYSGFSRGCPAGAGNDDLLTNTNPGAWYWTPAVGATSSNEIDFSATDSTGTIEIAAPWRNMFKSNP